MVCGRNGWWWDVPAAAGSALHGAAIACPVRQPRPQRLPCTMPRLPSVPSTDFSNPAFADAGMLDTPKGDDGAGPGANPLFDSQTSQLSGPEEGQNYAAGDKPGSR